MLKTNIYILENILRDSSMDVFLGIHHGVELKHKCNDCFCS